MGKKLLVLALVAVVMLGVFGLAGCDNVSLADYKATKSKALQDYADAKGVENYCEDGWQAVCKAVTDGKAAINVAKNKGIVDTAYKTAMDDIDAVQKEVGACKFYTLQEAYDEGLLTVEDLQGIATHYNNNTDPADTLSDATTKAIKETYRINMIDMPSALLTRINLYKYYGTYNDCVAIGITDDYNAYDIFVEAEYTVAGVVFYNFAISDIRIWNNKIKIPKYN